MSIVTNASTRATLFFRTHPIQTRDGLKQGHSTNQLPPMATWSNEAIITLIALILLVVQMVTHAIHFFYNHRQRTRSFDGQLLSTVEEMTL